MNHFRCRTWHLWEHRETGTLGWMHRRQKLQAYPCDQFLKRSRPKKNPLEASKSWQDQTTVINDQMILEPGLGGVIPTVRIKRIAVEYRGYWIYYYNDRIFSITLISVLFLEIRTFKDLFLNVASFFILLVHTDVINNCGPKNLHKASWFEIETLNLKGTQV